jgi:hypothetical protein
MNTHNWLQLAANRWPSAQVNGLGRYALKSETGGIFLYETERQAATCAAYHNSQVFDLAPCPVPTKCREIGWE